VGTPGAPALGQLGDGPLDGQVDAMERQVAAYGAGRQVLPVMELIAVVAQRAPGPDGEYRYRQPDRVVDQWLRVARAHKALLLLNIQPGRSDFLTEVRAYAKYLRQPDVGIALDPEWAMAPGQVPGRLFGHSTGAEINAVSAYLARVVGRYRLPQKVLVFHQVAGSVVTGLAALKPHAGVVVIRSVDGIGSPAQKTATWNDINRDRNPAVHPGFKLFFHEDRARSGGVLMSPQQVLALRPRPEYVMYE